MKTFISVLSFLLGTLSFNASGHHVPTAARSMFSLNVTNNILTLKKGSWLLESFFERRNFSGIDPYEMFFSKDVNDVNFYQFSSLRVNYGVSDKLTISISQPYYWVNHNSWGVDDNTGFWEPTENLESRLGNISLLSNYLIFKSKKSNFQVSVQGGLDLPIADKNSNGNQLYLNSGSINPILGLTASKNWNNLTAFFSVNSKYNTVTGNGMNIGDFYTYDMSFNYLMKKKHNDENGIECDSNCHETNKPVLTIFAGIKGELQNSNKYLSEAISNSGYYFQFIKVGAQIGIRNKVFMPVGFDIPVFQKINGIQNTVRWSMIIGLTFLI